jgi:N utilization substance protein A
MEPLRLSQEEIRYIALFENLTGAVTKDCIVDEGENRILFVVKNGTMGMAIGRKGANIQKVRQALAKRIEVIEHSEDPAEFVRNILHPIRMKEVTVSQEGDRRFIRLVVDERDKEQVLGRKGKNLQKIRMLMERHHGISEMIVV